MNSRDWKMFESMVKAATGVKHTHRYRTIEKNMTANAITSNPLLVADDDPDFDAGGDLTTACECEQGSRILGIDLNIHMKPGGAGKAIEFALYKDPDSIIGTGMDPATLFDQDLSANAALIRKYTLAYGQIVSSSTMEAKMMHIRISRAALARAGVMMDNDVLRFQVKNHHASTAGVLHCYGRIWTRK